jgi:hypothetical protein
VLRNLNIVQLLDRLRCGMCPGTQNASRIVDCPIAVSSSSSSIHLVELD